MSFSLEHKIPLKGAIEGFASGFLSGWVCDPCFPKQPQCFFVEVDGNLVTDSVAHCYREDLVDQGFESGYVGFYVDLGLTYNQVGGKLIRLLDKNHQPIQGAEFTVSDVGSQISFQLKSRNNNYFEFVVTCSSGLSEMPLSLRYGEACIALMSVSFSEGENTLRVAIPLDIIDGFDDTFVIELSGFPAPVWVAKQLNLLPCQSDSVNGTADLSTSTFMARARHKSLDIHLRDASVSSGLDYSLSAYRYLIGEDRSECLTYAQQKEIDVSVFIAFGTDVSAESLLHTLASIIFAYNRCSFELVFITNDKQKAMLIDIMRLHNVECRFFSVTDLRSFDLFFARLGAEARGKYSVVVNKPIEALSFWLDELIAPFKKSVQAPEVTTTKSISVKGDVLAPAMFLDINGQYWRTEQRVCSSHPSVSYTRKEKREDVSVWCVRSSLFSEPAGVTDEPYVFPSLDIKSLSYIRSRGLNIVYTPHAEVVSLAPLANTKTSLATDRDTKKKRVLLIDHAVPSINEDAGSYAAVQEIKLIQSLGYEVIFVDAKVSPYCEKAIYLQRLGVEVIYRPFFSSLSSVIHHYMSDICAIYITRYNVAERVFPIIKRVNALIPIIFNNADLHFLRELRSALNSGDPQKIHQATVTRDRELSVMDRADAILSYNDTEHAVITSHLLVSQKIHTCPWVLEEKKPGLPFASRQGIAFLGGYQHLPNVEAVVFFVEKVAPILEVKAPDIVFYVYGSNMPESFKSFASVNVKLIGFVDSLDDVYNKHRVFVAPLLSGAGIKGKVLESLAYGLPSVLSPVAAEGIGLTHNITTLQAESPEEWCEQIIHLYHDEVLWNRISQNLRIIAQDKFSFESGQKKMRKIFSSVGLE